MAKANTCSKCGAQIETLAQFCPYCGERTKKSSESMQFDYRVLQDRIREIDSETAPTDASIWTQNAYKFKQMQDGKKIGLIQSLPVPKEQGELLEFSYVCVGNAEVKIPFGEVHEGDEKIRQAWLAKASTCIGILEIMASKDPSISTIIMPIKKRLKKANSRMSMMGKFGLYMGLIVAGLLLFLAATKLFLS